MTARRAPKGPIKAKHDPMADVNPMPPRIPKCHAMSKTSGKTCAQPAIPGGTVCRYHGGAAPQVRQAAMERLKALQDRAIDRLAALLESGEYPSTAYQAARDILDRTMGKPSESVEIAHSGEMVIRWASDE